MLNSHILLYTLLPLILLDKAWLLNNGMALTPPMGWMSWGYYMCGDNCDRHPEKCLDENLILSVADAFYYDGYQEAGYEYIIIDDCWSERKRDRSGRLVPNRKRFPRGMKFLADYIHNLGLKFGMYTNIASKTCMRYPGSRGHFRKDAQTFASWDVDYLKVDGCFVEEPYLDEAYIELGRELNRTGRPMVYACSWPYYKKYIHNHEPNYTAVLPYCNLWRNYHDVAPAWRNVRGIIQYYEDHYNELHKFHGPGHWNDPDMLMLGTRSLEENESRIQMVVFAMLSAPLLMSCDMKMVTPYERSLLLNAELIAISQFSPYEMAKPHKRDHITVWVKKRQPRKGDKYHTYCFAFVNTITFPQDIEFRPSDFVKDRLAPDGYTIMNVLTGKFVKNITKDDIPYYMKVPERDVLLFTLYPI